MSLVQTDPNIPTTSAARPSGTPAVTPQTTEQEVFTLVPPTEAEFTAMMAQAQSQERAIQAEAEGAKGQDPDKAAMERMGFISEEPSKEPAKEDEPSAEVAETPEVPEPEGDEDGLIDAKRIRIDSLPDDDRKLVASAVAMMKSAKATGQPKSLEECLAFLKPKPAINSGPAPHERIADIDTRLGSIEADIQAAEQAEADAVSSGDTEQYLSNKKKGKALEAEKSNLLRESATIRHNAVAQVETSFRTQESAAKAQALATYPGIKDENSAHRKMVDAMYEQEKAKPKSAILHDPECLFILAERAAARLKIAPAPSKAEAAKTPAKTTAAPQANPLSKSSSVVTLKPSPATPASGSAGTSGSARAPAVPNWKTQEEWFAWAHGE